MCNRYKYDINLTSLHAYVKQASMKLVFTVSKNVYLNLIYVKLHMLHAAFSCFLNAVKFTRKYDNSKFPGYSLKIKEIKLRVWGKCGIITSDLKSA